MLLRTTLTVEVCPTYVGMNRGSILGRIRQDGMPHVCGDEPATAYTEKLLSMYAPRMWG